MGALVRALAIALGVLAGMVLAASGAEARPTPGASWIDGEHEGDVSDPCCGRFRVHANASDPDDSGLYDSALGNATTNWTSPQRAPPLPVSYEAALAANARAWDSTERDAFDNATARARAAVNLTLRYPVYQPLVNGTARAGVHCENRDRTVGPESCAGAAARADPLAAWRAALAAKRGGGGSSLAGLPRAHGSAFEGPGGGVAGSAGDLLAWLDASVPARR